jgi:hypothetical protein
MPYVTSTERVLERRGMREGIRAMLKICFGEEGQRTIPEIDDVHETAQLRAIIPAREAGKSLEAVRRIWAPNQ